MTAPLTSTNLRQHTEARAATSIKTRSGQEPSHRTQNIQSATMANIYEWLENIDPPSYAPISPPFTAPPDPRLKPMDRESFEDTSMDHITLFDIEGNMYFDAPPQDFIQSIHPS